MHPLTKFEYCPKCGSRHFNENGPKSRLCENCGFELFMNPSAATVAFILNSKGQLLVEKRKREPAKGMLDLPGGFADPGETAERGVRREVMEETGLNVSEATYVFSQPNIYRYAGMDIPTLDLFYRCEVEDDTCMVPADKEGEVECMWLDLKDIHTEQFGLRSVRWGLIQFLEAMKAEGKL